MGRSKDARQRILLHFLLGIALPSCLLGYLAFRGIQNDQALLERERRDELEAVGSMVRGAVDRRVTAAEASGEVAADPLVEASFILDSADRVQLLDALVLFWPGEAPDVAAGPGGTTESWSRELERARALELGRNDLAGALELYRRLVSDAPGDRERALALNALARTQMALGSFEEATRTYDRLRTDHGDTELFGGVPAGLAAGLAGAEAALAAGDTLDARAAYVGLYRDLARGRWTLSSASYGYYAGRVREALHAPGAFSSYDDASGTRWSDTVATLHGLEERARRRTERLLAFRTSGGNVLRGRLDSDEGAGSAQRAAPRRDALLVGEHEILVSVGAAPATALRAAPPPVTDSGRLRGIVIDREVLLDDVLAPILASAAAEVGAAWRVLDRSGRVLVASAAAPEEGPAVVGRFIGDFPPWTFELSTPDPRMVEAFLTSRRGVYFYAFLLLAGILGFGLLLTVRSVSHELELARLKSDFVSTVSHEFKSPLTAVRQLSELLATDRVPTEERRRHYYDVLVQQSERLSRLVDNVLDVARLETGALELELVPSSVAPVVEDAVARVQERVGHEGFEIRCRVEPDLPPAAIDSEGFAQALTNLIDNAVKYSGDSREVEVRAYATDDEVVVAVSDLGIGLDFEERERIFERFHRGGDALTRAVEGTGLGLTLVRGIMVAHGGRVEVESEPGRGSTFSLHLPVAADP